VGTKQNSRLNTKRPDYDGPGTYTAFEEAPGEQSAGVLSPKRARECKGLWEVGKNRQRVTVIKKTSASTGLEKTTEKIRLREAKHGNREGWERT